MTRFKTYANNALTFIDLLFDTMGAVARVFARASFAPDRFSFRSRRYFTVPKDSALVQRAQINAESAEQARRIIMTEPDRYLPLAANKVLLAVAGPHDPEAVNTASQEFLIGLAPTETVQMWRVNLGRAANDIEGFVVREPDGQPLVFRDRRADLIRQRRRAVTGAACATFVGALFFLDMRWRDLLEHRTLASVQEQSIVAHQILKGQRDIAQIDALLTRFDDSQALTPRRVLDTLDLLAERTPPASGLTTIALSPSGVTLAAQTYAAPEYELVLRRTFQENSVAFRQVNTASPALVEATIRAAAAGKPGAAP